MQLFKHLASLLLIVVIIFTLFVESTDKCYQLSIEPDKWVNDIAKGNVLLAIDYLNEICCHQKYEKIMFQLLQNDQSLLSKHWSLARTL